MNPVKEILIVGGGTAGWLSAAFLAKTLASKFEHGINITVVESPEIGIIGVGEGTFPSIRGTLAAIGIDENRFIKECNATFKQGIQFRHWVRPENTPGMDHYFHPFSQPSQRQGNPELLPYWLAGYAGKDVSYAQAVTMQKHIADASRGPKRNVDTDYMGTMNYAYHFDAGKFAVLLADHAKSLGVKHVKANVDDIALDEDGAIAYVNTKEHGQLTADLYLDCTGFRALLIGKTLGSEFHELKNSLFVDRALAIQTAYESEKSPIPSYTISTAHEAGWTWDIGLQQRRGVGYVYSSQHTSDSRAEEILGRYIGKLNENETPRLIKFNVGYRKQQWIKNCVSVGLSSGFLEPLEASGLGIIEAATYLIAHLFPFDGDFHSVSKLFNQQMNERYERISDFIKLHYCISQRTDSAFWRDNRHPSSIPSALQEKLQMWKCRTPSRLDFITDIEMYPPSSWQYVLYGMEYDTKLHPSAIDAFRIPSIQQEFQNITHFSKKATLDLPDHRELINRLIS